LGNAPESLNKEKFLPRLISASIMSMFKDYFNIFYRMEKYNTFFSLMNLSVQNLNPRLLQALIYSNQFSKSDRDRKNYRFTDKF